MVRATRSTRWKPRADRRIAAAASARSLRPGSSGVATRSSSSPSASALVRTPGRCSARPGPARAAATRRATSALPSAGGGRVRSAADTPGTSTCKIDAVEQRAGDPRLIIGGAARRAAAGERGIAEVAAAARVHRRDQLDPRRKGHVGVGAGDADASGLERLAQRIEHRALEFRQLVEEQDAEVREADLARADAQAAADQRRHRGAVVRRAERPAAPDLAAAELAGDRRDHRDFERFGRLERRKNARKARGEQRLARARRTAHQQIVPAGGGDLERALGDLLPLDLGQSGPPSGGFGLGRGRRRQPARCP